MWLHAHRDALPLACPSGERRERGRYRYDMPYWPSARDFYESVHTGSLDVSRRLLGDVIEGVSRFHESRRDGECSEAALAAYIDRKVVANGRAALDFARRQLPERYVINDDCFALADWDWLLDRDWLAAELSCRGVTAIHGDLTIDNIIVCPERDPGWYLIDANPGNLFDSELIDWAKLMQSLHLGYEALNRGPAARVETGAVSLLLSRSRVYADLHAHCASLLERRLGARQRREIALHEIINYLRLIPYKIRHQPAKAMTFFTATSLLLRTYQAGAP